MAQLGDLVRAEALLQRAARGFGPTEAAIDAHFSSAASTGAFPPAAQPFTRCRPFLLTRREIDALGMIVSSRRHPANF